MTAKTTKKAAPSTSEAMESMVAAGQEATESALKVATESYEKAFTTAKRRVDEMVKGYDDVAGMTKENVEAMVAASNACARGFEQLTTVWLGFSKRSLEDGIAAGKAMMGAKTLQEVLDLQSSFARSQFDSFVSQTTKAGEVATKVAQETVEPINLRVTAAVDRWVKHAA